jgi:hypothetical protein
VIERDVDEWAASFRAGDGPPVAHAARGDAVRALGVREGTRADGASFAHVRDAAPGDPELPLTAEQIDEKLHRAGASAGLRVDELLAAPLEALTRARVRA